MSEALPREATSTQPPDLFVELFAQPFGLDKVQLLSPENPVQDIYGATRFVDFANRERRFGIVCAQLVRLQFDDAGSGTVPWEMC